MTMVEKAGIQPQPDVLGLAEQAKTVPITTRHGTSAASRPLAWTIGRSVSFVAAGRRKMDRAEELANQGRRLVSCKAG